MKEYHLSEPRIAYVLSHCKKKEQDFLRPYLVSRKIVGFPERIYMVMNKKPA